MPKINIPNYSLHKATFNTILKILSILSKTTICLRLQYIRGNTEARQAVKNMSRVSRGHKLPPTRTKTSMIDAIGGGKILLQPMQVSLFGKVTAFRAIF